MGCGGVTTMGGCKHGISGVKLLALGLAVGDGEEAEERAHLVGVRTRYGDAAEVDLEIPQQPQA